MLRFDVLLDVFQQTVRKVSRKGGYYHR